METKSNEATPLRPEGERVLNAPLVQMDLDKYMAQLKRESTWDTSSHNSITLFKSEKLRIVLIGIHKNGEIKKHKAPGPISVQVIKGHLAFSAMKETVDLKVGQMLTLLPKIPHSLHAEEECFFLLTMAK